MEVFQVNTGLVTAANKKPKLNTFDVNEVEIFSKEVNAAINGKWKALQEAEVETLSLENSFKDEEDFISSFAAGRPQDVVTLSVCGTKMATRLQTLTLCKSSILASKFSNNAEGAGASDGKTVEQWNHEDVVAWLTKLEGIPGAVAKEFEENQVTGRELLALGAEGLKDFGVARKGTIYLLLNEIKKLERAGSDAPTLIEHSPYCFGKILDHLRLEGAFMKGLVKTKHGTPIVCEDERGRYQKIVKHLFPGEGLKMFEDGRN